MIDLGQKFGRSSFGVLGSRVLGRRVLGLCTAAALVLSVAMIGPREAASGSVFSGPLTAGKASTSHALPTFDELYVAQQATAQRIIRERRTLMPNAAGPGSVVDSLREHLILDGVDANGRPRFSLELLAVVDPSGPLTPTTSQSERFAGHAAYLEQHSGFRIEDPVLAEENYTLIPVGVSTQPLIADYQLALTDPSTRPFAMPAHQVELRGISTLIAVPKTVNRSPWLLQVDLMTHRILRSVSYDTLGQPICETVVLHESDLPVGGTTPTFWQPSQPTTEFPDFASALPTLPAAPWAQPDPGLLPAGYALSRIRVVREAFGPKVSVVQIYADGIDELFVVQTLNARRAFVTTTKGADEVILTHRDRDVDQFLFHLGALETAVVGRAGHQELSGLAAELLIEASNRNN